MSEVTFSGNTIGDKALYLKGVERGEKNERERIIKLLEERLRGVIAVGTDEKTWYWIDGMNDAIALIKGENK